MTKQTALYQQHQALGGKMVDFAGWEMPLHYGSQKDEHHVVRQAAGMFDVSHMTVVDIKGVDAKAFLQRLLANDVAKLTPGKALYSCMLNHEGGIIDDLIVYDMDQGDYRVVVNAGTREKDLAWLQEQSQAYDVTVTERPELAMIAVQGPEARQKVAGLMSEACAEALLAIKPFSMACQGDNMVARTGYTGEDGFEIIMPNDKIEAFWEKLLAVGVQACGLGARDTLRLEAGMNLYGTDMDETTSPLVSGLAWTLAMKGDRDFIGRKALEAEKQAGVCQQMVGLVMTKKGVLRGHQVVKTTAGDGEITSGTFSPTLGHSIAMARLPKGFDANVSAEIRNKLLPVTIVKLPFVRQGQKVYKPIFETVEQ